jgi:hypothetical protein
MDKTRNIIGICGIAIVLGVLAGVGSALAGFATGEDYLKSNDAYKVGYAAGAIDMAAGLHELKLLKPGSFNDDTDKVVKCISSKKVKPSGVANAYAKYLEANPQRKSGTAAGDIFVALKMACSSS